MENFIPSQIPVISDFFSIYRTVALNGRTLSLNPDFSLPSMDYPEVVTSNFTFPQESFGFIVIPDANVATCKVSSWWKNRTRTDVKIQKSSNRIRHV